MDRNHPSQRVKLYIKFSPEYKCMTFQLPRIRLIFHEKKNSIISDHKGWWLFFLVNLEPGENSIISDHKGRCLFWWIRSQENMRNHLHAQTSDLTALSHATITKSLVQRKRYVDITCVPLSIQLKWPFAGKKNNC